MRKLLLFLLFPVLIHGATITWLGTTSSAKTATNWVGAVLPSATDTAYFGAVNLGPCTFDSSFSIASVRAGLGYSGAISLSGQTLTLSDNFIIDTCGALDLGNGITMNGATGLFRTGGATIGAITGSACNLIMNTANGTIYEGKQLPLKTLTINGNVLATGHTGGFGGPLDMYMLTGGTGLIYQSGLFTSNINIGVYTNTSGHAYSSGLLLAGTGDFGVYINASNVIDTLLPITSTSTGLYSLQTGNGASGFTFQMVGLISMLNCPLVNSYNNTGGAETINFSDFIAPSATTYCGASTGHSITYNYGSGHVTFGNYLVYFTAGSVNCNFQTSFDTCYGFWTSGGTVNEGTSTKIFKGTGASVVTLNGNSFYDVEVNNVSKAFSFSGAASVHNLTTTAMASYSNSSTTLTASGNVLFNGAGSVNVGNGVTLTGTTSGLTFNNTLFSAGFAAAGTVSYNNSTSGTFTDNKGASFAGFIEGVGALVTVNGAANTQIAASSGALVTLGNNAALTNNGSLFLTCSGTATPFSLGTGITLNGNNTYLLYTANTTTGTTIPAIPYTGTGAWFFSTVTSGAIWNMGGNLNFGSDTTAQYHVFSIYSEAGSLIFNTNGYNLTAARYRGGSPYATTCTINYSNSVIHIGAYDGTTYSTSGETYTVNMNSSTWYDSGACVFDPYSTIHQNTATFNKTTCTPATLNGQPVRVYYPPLSPIAYGTSTFTDTVGKAHTHALAISGCSLGKDSVVLIGSWPAGYSINASTGLISWSGSGSVVAGNYVVRSYGNAKTDSASVTVTVGVVTAQATSRRRHGVLDLRLGIGR